MVKLAKNLHEVMQSKTSNVQAAPKLWGCKTSFFTNCPMGIKIMHLICFTALFVETMFL